MKKLLTLILFLLVLSIGVNAIDNIDLIAYYNFTSDANDSSGNGNDGIIENATLVNGKIDNAFQFNGTNTYINTTLGLSFAQTNGFSVCMWIKNNNTKQDSNIFGSIAENGASDSSFALRISSSAKYDLFVRDTSSNSFSVVGNTIKINTWQHICMVRNIDLDTFIMYEDGIQTISESDTTVAFDFSPASWYIGARNLRGIADSFYNGTVDEVNIWNRTLDKYEVQRLYLHSLDNNTPLEINISTNNTFYMSDSGSDDNSGLSSVNPFNSFDKLDEINMKANDNILFNSDDTFRLTSDFISDNGDSSGYIRYGSYSTGSFPLILLSINGSNSSKWSNGGSGNIYNYSDSLTTEIGNIIFNTSGNVFTATNYTKSYGELNDQWEFYYDFTSDTLSLYSSANPTTLTSEIEMALALKGFDLNDRNYLIFENLDFRYSAASCIFGARTDNIHIQNLNCHYTGGYMDETSIRFGGGLGFFSNATNNYVKNSNISNAFDSCITAQVGVTVLNTNISNINISNNIIYRCKYGIEIFSNHGTGILRDIFIEHNTIIESGYEWSKNQRWGVAFGRSILLSRGPGDSDNIIIRNNLLSNSSERHFDLGRGNSVWNTTEPSLDYDLYYVGNPIVSYNSTSYTTLALFQSGEGQEANGIEGDPLLNSDFSLQAGSPANGTASDGTNIGAWQGDAEALDTTPPTISNLRNLSTTNVSSIIAWTCDENCNFTLSLYNSSALVETRSNTTLSLNHNPLFTGLLFNTNYLVNLTVEDAANNNITNNTFSFTTEGSSITPTPTTPTTQTNLIILAFIIAFTLIASFYSILTLVIVTKMIILVSKREKDYLKHIKELIPAIIIVIGNAVLVVLAIIILSIMGSSL